MLKNGKTVSTVVSIYNEERTLKKVIETLLSFDILDEIVCVNDGSLDATEEILDSFGDKIIKVSYKTNKGKGFAMSEGVKTAKSDLILFLDADFSNLQEKHVHILLDPLEDLEIEGTTATMYRAGPRTLLNEINGQRVYYKKDLVPLLPEMRKSRYGVEVLLNKSFKGKNVLRKFIGRDIGHVYKQNKYSPLEALQEYLLEISEIAQQLIKMEKVVPEDKKIIDTLKTSKTFVEFNRRIEKLKNKKIQGILQEYAEKYLKIPLD